MSNWQPLRNPSLSIYAYKGFICSAVHKDREVVYRPVNNPFLRKNKEKSAGI